MADGYSETIVFQRGAERLNGASWHPAGTLACAVLHTVHHWPPEPPSVVSVLSKVLAENTRSPRQQAPGSVSGTPSVVTSIALALVQTAQRQKPVPVWVSLASALVQQEQRYVRDLVARALQPRRFAAAPPPRDLAQLLGVSRLVDALSRRPPSLHLEPPLRDIVQWAGLNDDGTEIFRATPAGAVLLSLVYGVQRRRLHVCKDCQDLVVSPRPRGKPRYCENCQALRNRQPRSGESKKPAAWKTHAWTRVLERMRKRGFKRQRLTSFEQQANWKKWAHSCFDGVKKREDLAQWEQTVAPMGMPGRPRKDRTAKEATTTGR